MFSLFTAPTLPVFPELPPQLESEAIAVTPSATVSAEQQPVRELEPETPQGNISTGVRACIASTLLTLLTRSKAASHIYVNGVKYVRFDLSLEVVVDFFRDSLLDAMHQRAAKTETVKKLPLKVKCDIPAPVHTLMFSTSQKITVRDPEKLPEILAEYVVRPLSPERDNLLIIILEKL